MADHPSLLQTAWSLLQDKLKPIFVSRAKRKRDADAYSGMCKTAWRIAKDVAEEARTVEGQCRAAQDGADFSYTGGRLAELETALQDLKARHCPAELAATARDLETLVVWLAASSAHMHSADAAERSATIGEATTRRVAAELIEAQLVVNARHAANEADKFVDW